jgi:hypothetical protein
VASGRGPTTRTFEAEYHPMRSTAPEWWPPDGAGTTRRRITPR